MKSVIMDSTAVTRKKALTALALLLPIPSLGVLIGMILLPDTTLGAVLFFLCKTWILVLPTFWHIWINKERWSWSPPLHGGLWLGVVLGLVISAIIISAYLMLGEHLIDPSLLQTSMEQIGMATPMVYLGLAAYWTLINSVLEEYVWRWFVVQEAEKLMRPIAAVVFSALGFTLHHIVAMQLYFNWGTVIIAALGVFIGGAIWSWCYLKFRSIWPGYLSHALVDLTLFGIGYRIIFG